VAADCTAVPTGLASVPPLSKPDILRDVRLSLRKRRCSI